MEEKRKAPSLFLRLAMQDADGARSMADIPMSDVVAAVAPTMAASGRRIEVEVAMADGAGMELRTMFDADPEYPGVSIDAVKTSRKDGTEVRSYVASAELPNRDHPQVMARLYAGDEEDETDSPVAIMAYGRRDPADDSRRALFLDHDFVETWSDKYLPMGGPVPLTTKEAIQTKSALKSRK